MHFAKNCKNFRELMRKDCVMLPGAFNGMSGRLAAENGNNLLYFRNIITYFYIYIKDSKDYTYPEPL